MGKIIKAEFKKNDQKSIEDMTREELLQSYEDEEIARIKLKNLQARLVNPKAEQYTIVVSRIKPYAATYRSTPNIEKAWDVYQELEEHIKNSDRTFDELVMMLNGKIES